QGEGSGMLQGTDEITCAGERTDPPHPSPPQSPAPAPSLQPESPGWPSPAQASRPASSGPAPRALAAPSPQDPEAGARPGGGEARQEILVARETRAAGLVGGLTAAEVAAEIHDRCGPFAGTSRIRAYRLALGVSLADVVAQIRAWYANEGRPAPRFSETLLSAYESGQKRPGPEYLHYLCAVYRADPPDLGYPDPCFCGREHGGEGTARAPAGPALPPPAAVGGPAGQLSAVPGYFPAEPGPAASPRPAQVGPAGPRPAGGHGAAVGLPWSVVMADAGPEDDDDVVRRMLLRLIADATVAVD